MSIDSNKEKKFMNPKFLFLLRLPETIEDFEEDGLVNPFRCFRRRKVYDEKLAESRTCAESLVNCFRLVECPPCRFAEDEKAHHPFKRHIVLCSDFKEEKRESVPTYEPERVRRERIQWRERR